MFQLEDDSVRHPAVAGMFYPRSPQALREAIAAAFHSPLGPGNVPDVQAGPRRLVGVVVPHAGYPYSAQCAAWAFAEVARDGRPGAVVILGVNHRGVGAPLALSPARGWEIPLGVSPVASALGEQLMRMYPSVSLDDRAHIQEHAIEVQAPFVQFLFGELPILPIAIGQASLTAMRDLGNALATLARAWDILLVASTDLSHYVSQSRAERQDRQVLAQIEAVDPEGLVKIVREQGITMCGVLPVAAMLFAAEALGVRSARLLHYHTSGDVTGDYQEVVGYGAAAAFR